MACPGCGYGENPADAIYCENCGAGISRVDPAPSPMGGAMRGAQAPAAEAATAATVALAEAADGSVPSVADSQVHSPLPDHLAETMPLPGPAVVEAWTCACGEENPAGEVYCDGCGEPRAVSQPALAPGDTFAGYTIVEQSDAQSYAVRPDSSPDEPVAVLRFEGTAALVKTIGALEPATLAANAGHPLLPDVLASGVDPVRGPYAFMSEPPGPWQALGQAAPVAGPLAAEMLAALLLAVESAARAQRLLILSPVLVQFDGARIFIPQPVAPELPLSGPLLADPAFLAPEVRAEATSVDAWAAGAFAAGALVHALAGNALGFPREWHTLMARLQAQDPSRRPANRAEVLEALRASAVRRFVGFHRTAFKTDIGHHHPVNQDAGGVWTWQRWDGTPVTLAVVADGVSAGKRSEEASAVTVALVHEAVEAHVRDRDFDPEAADRVLLEAGCAAHQQVCAMPYDNYDEANATTLVAACVIGSTVTGIWCGDSRAYGVTPEGCRQVTKDHSWVNLMVDSGQMSLEQARLDPRAHVIARWLGVSEPASANPGFDRFRLELAPGDRVLVCSDGLYMYYDPPEWGEFELPQGTFSHGDDVEAAVDELIATALDRGGFDNVTAVVVAIE